MLTITAAIDTLCELVENGFTRDQALEFLVVHLEDSPEEEDQNLAAAIQLALDAEAAAEAAEAEAADI